MSEKIEEIREWLSSEYRVEELAYDHVSYLLSELDAARQRIGELQIAYSRRETYWSQQLDAAKQENERIDRFRMENHRVALVSQQRMRQAIEALEKIANVTHGGTSSALYARRILSILREESITPLLDKEG